MKAMVLAFFGLLGLCSISFGAQNVYLIAGSAPAVIGNYLVSCSAAVPAITDAPTVTSTTCRCEDRQDNKSYQELIQVKWLSDGTRRETSLGRYKGPREILGTKCETLVHESLQCRDSIE